MHILNILQHYSKTGRKALARLLCIGLFTVSCVTMPDWVNGKGDGDGGGDIPKDLPSYLYPFGEEVKGNLTVTVSITTGGAPPPAGATATIPALKYDKRLLVMLTQDDCKQAALCRTWATINDKPLSDNPRGYYHYLHLAAGDLPPDAHTRGKTLASTDGAGNDVRFAFTFTLLPASSNMNKAPSVSTGNIYRFNMRPTLIWSDVREMLNFGNSMAFHDVQLPLAHNFGVYQAEIARQLGGRVCKVLAIPNGDMSYEQAMLQYDPIKIATGEKGHHLKLYPATVGNDLSKRIVHRFFKDGQIDAFKGWIDERAAAPYDSRQAMHMGTHNMPEDDWTGLLTWINDNYGRDGDDSAWFPSLEEYYEYNRLRLGASITPTISGNTLTLTIVMPLGDSCYYPSLSLLAGVSGVTSVTASGNVTGLSWAAHGDGTLINIDCRRYLEAQARHYVERYEKSQGQTDLADAKYFVGKLAPSSSKEQLKARLP